ncbi:MAG: tetratricopeptide repeat protein [Myxococcales bacterium]|nr:tetratricopeptide repeat protein [Myxococcales bacterium]
MREDPASPPIFRDEDGEEQSLPAEFATAIMGHILLQQGRAAEAAAVFRAVLAQHPDDPEALRGLRALDGDPAPAAPPRAWAEATELECVPIDPTRLAVRWAVAAEALAAVGAPLDAPLALERVSLAVGATEITRDAAACEAIEPAGHCTLEGLSPGALHHLAVGLRRADGRFVPLAQATPVATPRPLSLPPTPGPGERVTAPRSAAGALGDSAAGDTAADPKIFAFYAAAWARGVQSSQ